MFLQDKKAVWIHDKARYEYKDAYNPTWIKNKDDIRNKSAQLKKQRTRRQTQDDKGMVNNFKFFEIER